jgi:hypothetical protein
MSVAQLESLERAAVCRNSVACQLYPDQATCMATTVTEMQTQAYDTLVHDVTSGKVLYDQARAPGCVAALDTFDTPADCTRSGALAAPFNTACAGIFTGTVALGGTCFFSFECATGGVCSQDHCTQGQCCAGTCTSTAPTLGPGDDCTDVGSAACPADEACTFDPALGRDACQPRGAVGAPCNQPNTCVIGLNCDSGSQTCKPLAATGQPCDPDTDSCDSIDDVCELANPICTPRLAIGSPCQPDEYNCIDYAACDPSTGTCVAEPVVGQGCDPNGLPCLVSQCDPTTRVCTLVATTQGACY